MPEFVEVKRPIADFFLSILRPGSRRLPRLFLVISLASALLLCLPFLRNIRSAGLEMNIFLQGLIFFLTAAQICHRYLRFGTLNILRLLSVPFIVSCVAEWVGMHWNGVFGSVYSYNPALAPRLTDQLPFCIPLVWFWLTYMAEFFLGPMTQASGGRRLFKAVIGALYITALDFVFEPLGVSSGAWVWDEPGGYFGTPIRNFTGWFMVGLVICLSLSIFDKRVPDRQKPEPLFFDGLFAGVSIFLSLVCSAACLFRLGAFLPAALSLSITIPCWAFWGASLKKTR